MGARALLVLAGLAVGFVLLEVGLRTLGTVPEVENPLYSFHQSDPDLGWIGVPGLRRRFVRPDFDVEIRHGGAGFRLPEPEPPVDADERVLVLGDSFTWGWGVGQGRVFTDEMQRRLGPRASLHNRGVNGFGTAQQWILLRRELASGRWDTVVVLFTGNDFADNLDPKAGRRPYFELVGDELRARNQPPTPLMSPLKRLWKSSRAAVWLDYRSSLAFGRLRDLVGGRAATPTEPPPVAPSESEIAVTERLLREMRRDTEAHGGRFVVVGWQGPPFGPALAQLCRRAGLECLDLSSTFADGARTRSGLRFPSDEHWTVDGHRTAAALLGKELFRDDDLRTAPSAPPSPTPGPRSTLRAGSPGTRRTASSGTP